MCRRAHSNYDVAGTTYRSCLDIVMDPHFVHIRLAFKWRSREADWKISRLNKKDVWY